MGFFADIIGQDSAIEQLRLGISSGRMPHAMLFAGPEGVGRRTTATALAAALLCENTSEKAGKFDACGTCASCKLIQAGAHPDCRLIYKELARFHENQQVRNRKMQVLGIDVIRSFLIDAANQASSQGRGRMFIVREAQLMNDAAQNALLKTLEEPPDGVTIVLCCTSVERMLATIRSRCCLVRFAPLPRDFVATRLRDADVPGEKAEFWAAFTDGSIGRAMRLSQGDLYEIKRGMIERFSSLPPAGDVEYGSELAKIMETLAIKAVSEQKKADGSELAKTLASRRAAGTMLRLIAGAYRDALVLLAGCEQTLTHADQTEEIRSLANRFSASQLAGILEDLSECERLLWRNVNPKIVWDNAVILCASASRLRI